jgi:hypothetical protein
MLRPTEVWPAFALLSGGSACSVRFDSDERHSSWTSGQTRRHLLYLGDERIERGSPRKDPKSPSIFISSESRDASIQSFGGTIPQIPHFSQSLPKRPDYVALPRSNLGPELRA